MLPTEKIVLPTLPKAVAHRAMLSQKTLVSGETGEGEDIGKAFTRVAERVISARRAVSESLIGSGFGIAPEDERIRTLGGAVELSERVGLPIWFLVHEKDKGYTIVCSAESADGALGRLILLQKKGGRVGAFVPRRNGDSTREMPMLFVRKNGDGFECPPELEYGDDDELITMINGITSGDEATLGDFPLD